MLLNLTNAARMLRLLPHELQAALALGMIPARRDHDGSPLFLLSDVLALQASLASGEVL